MLLLITLALCDMTQATKAKITSVAYKARKWAQTYADKHGYDSDLGCMCAIASAHLFKLLTKAGIKAKLAYNSKHCFVLSNGYLVDITATQFLGCTTRCSLPLTEIVLVEKYSSIKQRPYWWTVEEKFDSIPALRDYQQETHWPEEQIALPA